MKVFTPLVWNSVIPLDKIDTRLEIKMDKVMDKVKKEKVYSSLYDRDFNKL